MCLKMDEVMTMEKFPNPTIVSGQLAQVYGMPVVVSEFLSADLQATGLFTTTGGSTSSMMIVNTDRFKIGQLRGTTLEVDKDITRGTHQMVTTVRETFFTVDSSTKKNLRLMFNL